MKETIRVSKLARIRLKERSIFLIQKGDYVTFDRIGTTLVIRKCKVDDMGYKVKVGKNLDIRIPKTYFEQIQITLPTNMVIQYHASYMMMALEAVAISQDKDISLAKPLAIGTVLDTNMVLTIPCYFWREETSKQSYLTYQVIKDSLLVKRIENECNYYHLRYNQIYISYQAAKKLKFIRSDIVYVRQLDLNTFILSKTSELQKEALLERKSKYKYKKEKKVIDMVEPEIYPKDRLLKRNLLLENFANTHYLVSK